MIETRNATAALSGTEKAVEFATAYNYFYIKNDSPDTVYVSMSPNITAGADGIFAVDAGGSCGTAHGYPATKLYLLGTGSVQVCGTGSADNPFKPASRGGDGKNADKASSYVLNGAADYPLIALSLYGKSAQDGAPAPDAPVDIVSVGDSGSISISTNDITAAITSSLPLCGIPVASGGNYTDSTGQMWCCDELVYNADGTGKIIKHVGKIVFSGGDAEQWIQPNINAEFTNDFRIQHKLQNTLAAKLSTIKTELICSRLPFNYSIWSSDILGCHIAQNGDFVLRMPSSVVGGTDIAAFKMWLSGNPLTVIYQLAEPQEVSLTTAEMSALRSLQTFEGVTNISNSADAEMSVKYCTSKALAEYVKPLINGLQAQIDTLSAAILSLGGNV